MTEQTPGIGDVDMIQPEPDWISDEERSGMAHHGEQPQPVRDTSADGPLGNSDLAGVGRLSEVMGVEGARHYVTAIEGTRKYLYARALRRWGPPTGHQVRVGSAALRKHS